MKLFCYGTLRWPQIISRLLGKEPPHIPASVLGKIVKHPNNYEDLVAGHYTIEGELYELNSNELAKIVNWERRYVLRQIRTTAGDLVHYFKMKDAR